VVQQAAAHENSVYIIQHFAAISLLNTGASNPDQIPSRLYTGQPGAYRFPYEPPCSVSLDCSPYLFACNEPTPNGVSISGRGIQYN
jgi:hypothetical protein